MTAVAPDVSEGRTKNAWPALLALCIGFFMLLLDTTIVNIAIPKMIPALNTNLEDIIWVNSIYLLANAVPLLVTGRLGDRFGPKRVFLVGLFLFTASSLACGLASTVEPLIIARAVQGLGAAAMMPQTMAFIYHLFPAGKRGAAMGVWGATAGLATVSGPLLGGILVEAFDWESIFYVNIPIGIIGFILVMRLVPDWQPRHSHRFDPLGILLFCVGLGAVVFGLQEGQHYEWGTITGPISVYGLIVAGVVLLALFAIWQFRNRTEPLLPMKLFGHRSFSLSILASSALGFALIGTILPLMLYLQSVRGYSALQAGLVTMAMAASSGVTSAIVGRIAERVDGRRLGAIGFVGYATGLGLLAWILQYDTPPLMIALPLAIAGIGMGCIFAPLATLGTLGLPPQLVGAGAGLFNTMRTVGSVIGSAAIGVLLQARIAVELPAQAAAQAGQLPAEVREGFITGMTEASSGSMNEFSGGPGFSLPEGIPADVAEHIRVVAKHTFELGFTSATKTSILLPACILLLGVVALLAIPKVAKKS